MALLVVLLVPFVSPAAPASSSHNADQHSDNMSLLFNAPNATGAVNSDLAFWGNRAYAGNYNGFRIFDIANPSSPQQLVDFRCDGPQNDTVVWQNKLLFTAVDRTLTGPECGSARTVDPADPTGWEGVRIFDVSNPRAPRFIKGVYTDCGAHTITLFPKNRGEVLIYVSSYPLQAGPTCGPIRGPENGNSPLHEKISVIKVPVHAPHTARVVAQPKISYPGDPDNTFDPAEHGLVGFNPLTACHDIAVHVEKRLAAGACAEQTQLWRIKSNGIPDTEHPIWVFDDNTDTDGPGGGDVAVDFWHTTRFTPDGKYLQADDESFGDGCPTTTPGIGDTGRTHFLNARTGERESTFTLPRTEEGAYCTVHQGNFVQTRDHRYLSVSAWYMGGVNVIDFTDPENPVEVAYYDIAGAGPAGSDNWSAYWYEGPSASRDSLTIYATDGVHTPASGRGFQVFRADIDVREQRLDHMNPQTTD
jgi:hypothetical protein